MPFLTFNQQNFLARSSHFNKDELLNVVVKAETSYVCLVQGQKTGMSRNPGSFPKASKK